MLHTQAELMQLTSLPLAAKVVYSQQRIKQWHEYWGGNVYVSYSGGKASTVLLHLVRDLYPDTDAIFVDASTEFPEVRAFAMGHPRITIIRPKEDFRKVVQAKGYPIISKRVSRILCYAQQGSPWALQWIENKFASGEERHTCLMKKWRYLVDAPFRISDACCEITKHEPFRRYERLTKNKPFVGLQTCESYGRQQAWLKKGCNEYNTRYASSNPLSIWSDQDLWEYIKQNNLPHCSLYDMGYKRTGCAFCCFGVHLEAHPHRFEVMRQSHPKLFDYCMRGLDSNGLGLRDVLKHIGVDMDHGEQVSLWPIP